MTVREKKSHNVKKNLLTVSALGARVIPLPRATQPTNQPSKMRTTKKQATALANWYGQNWENEIAADLAELKSGEMPDITRPTSGEFAPAKTAARAAFWEIAANQ